MQVTEDAKQVIQEQLEQTLENENAEPIVILVYRYFMRS